MDSLLFLSYRLVRKAGQFEGGWLRYDDRCRYRLLLSREAGGKTLSGDLDNRRGAEHLVLR